MIPAQPFDTDIALDSSLGKTTGEFLLNDSTTRAQFGALCWRMHGGQPEVLLITSRDTGRWIIPKGWPIDGLTPEAAAAREAWEEAGVTGEISATSVGLYRYSKALTADRSVPCLVAVYPLRVGKLAKRYPEVGQRRRKWFPADKAAKKVDEPELREILAGFVPKLLPEPHRSGDVATVDSAAREELRHAIGEAPSQVDRAGPLSPGRRVPD